MEAVIKLNIEELSAEFVNNLKKLFPGKNVEIKVEEEMDTTDYILSNPAYANELSERIRSIEDNTATLITVKPEDLL